MEGKGVRTTPSPSPRAEPPQVSSPGLLPQVSPTMRGLRNPPHPGQTPAGQGLDSGAVWEAPGVCFPPGFLAGEAAATSTAHSSPQQVPAPSATLFYLPRPGGGLLFLAFAFFFIPMSHVVKISDSIDQQEALPVFVLMLIFNPKQYYAAVCHHPPWPCSLLEREPPRCTDPDQLPFRGCAKALLATK